MERYAPTLMDLAPRDMVSRAIYQEIRAGRGIDGKDYVYLDVRHLGRKVIEEKLPDITDFARVYQGVEPITEPVPIQPTAHYAMGGIPTDLDTRVTRDAAGDRRSRAVRGRRVRLRQRPRRQPARHELARRPARLRSAGRAGQMADGRARASTFADDARRRRGAGPGRDRGAPRADRPARTRPTSARTWPT